MFSNYIEEEEDFNISQKRVTQADKKLLRKIQTVKISSIQRLIRKGRVRVTENVEI